MAYEHLYSKNLLSKEVTFGDTTETLYFKHLTAGEKMQLNKGLKGEVQAGVSTFELDLGELEEKNHLKLFYTNVDENGKRVFKNVKEVSDLPDSIYSIILATCNELLGGENPN